MKRLPIPSELQDLFERAIDTHGLANVVDALSEICAAKAEHVAANWQDGPLASQWAHLGWTLEQAQLQAHARGL